LPTQLNTIELSFDSPQPTIEINIPNYTQYPSFIGFPPHQTLFPEHIPHHSLFQEHTTYHTHHPERTKER